MNNSIGTGTRIPYTAGANIASGQAVVIGSQLGVACGAIANGARGVVELGGGPYRLPKLAAANIPQGARLTWDVTAGEFIIASAAVGDLENCAIATEAAAATTTTVNVLLCPGVGAIKAE